MSSPSAHSDSDDEQRHDGLRLVVAHINDTHSHFDPSVLSLNLESQNLQASQKALPVMVGGFARLKTAITDARQRALDSGAGFLALHAGDCFQGTLYFTLHKGIANADLLNTLDLDAMTLGNHEFDLGNERLVEFASRVGFPLLAANMDLSAESTVKCQRLSDQSNIFSYDAEQQCGRYLVKTFHGVEVAVMGITLEAMHSIANPDSDTTFKNPAESLKRMVSDAHSKGIQRIVVLSHLGYEADRELAQAVEGISLIVGGHTHQLLGDFRGVGLGFSGEYAEIINQTAVVQAGCNALALGKVHIHWDQNGKLLSVSGSNRLLLDDTSLSNLSTEQRALYQPLLQQHPNILWAEVDPEVENLLAQTYRPKALSWHQDVVAHIEEPLRHVRIPDSNGASQICPTVARALHWQIQQLGMPVDFGLHNAGGTRTSLAQGPISAADISGKLLPFALNIGLRSVSGNQLLWALEGALDVALADGGTHGGSFPYTYGLDYQVDFKAAYGKRVSHLKILRNGIYVPVKPDELYSCVTNAYTGSGKEGYDALAQGNEWYQVGIPLSEVFVNYARKQKRLAKSDSPVRYLLGSVNKP
jgi:5'-nucleotidase